MRARRGVDQCELQCKSIKMKTHRTTLPQHSMLYLVFWLFCFQFWRKKTFFCHRSSKVCHSLRKKHSKQHMKLYWVLKSDLPLHLTDQIWSHPIMCIALKSNIALNPFFQISKLHVNSLYYTIYWSQPLFIVFNATEVIFLFPEKTQ